MRYIPPFILLLIGATTLQAQEVTLPLARYEELRERAFPEPEPEPESPLPVAFEEAVLDAEVGPSSARIIQELVLEIYGEGWHKVSLPQTGTFIDADFGSLEGRLDGAALVLRGQGRHRVRLISVVPVRRDETATRPTWRLELEAPKAALVRGSVRLGETVEDVAGDGPVILYEAADDGRRAWLAEPGGRFGFTLHGAAIAPERARLPLRFDAVTAAVLDVSRSRRRLDARLAVRVLQGELHAVRVPLPEGFEVVDVDGPIAGWDVAEERLTVTPLMAVTDALALRVELTGPPADEFASPALAIDGAAGLLAASKVKVSGDALLNLLDPGAARQPDGRQEKRLPPWFRDAPGLALVVGREDAAPRWQIAWPDSTEVLAAQVDRLLIDAVVGDSGRAAYQLWAEVRSSGAPQLALALPGAELIAARRDGTPLDPGRSAAGWVVPLSATSEPQVIHLALVLPLELPPAGGELDLPVPVLSAPVGRVEVVVGLPGERRYELADANRYGAVAPPPGVAVRREASLVAQQLAVMTPVAMVGADAGFLARPSGLASIQARWSALSSSPAPLKILVKPDPARKEWF